MPRITLCMIVRDEEAMLPACLESVAGVVDEMVIVDTGSEDGTVAIAKAAGAKVVHFPWCDDFAAARNAALPDATGEWILVLDADERLAPGCGRLLRAVADNARFDCGVLPLLNAIHLEATAEGILNGTERSGEPILLPRFVRNAPDLQWSGRVHESVDDWLKSNGCRVTRIDCPILHYGAVADLRLELGKAERNLALLERRCAEEPDRPGPFVYLSHELGRAGQPKRAYEAAVRAWTNLCAALRPFEEPNGRVRVDGLPSIEGPCSLLAALLLGRGAAGEALGVLDQAERWGARHPNFLMLRGTAFESMVVRASGEERRELLRRAAAAYRAALS
ncbi:MAG: glycosyltransferase family 2 protein, partial [Myxococcota bacterium]|nr:glycosyltransferase family 2 protein [Myxococcota bacterium]